MKTIAIIPSRYEPLRLRSLLLSLHDTDVVILDNGHNPPLNQRWSDLIEVIDTREMGIYAMWNLGVRLARERGYEAVALLNDDVRILPGTIPFLARAMADPRTGVVYPDWPLPLSAGLPQRVHIEPTRGTVRTRGMTGFAFMFRTSLRVPGFDEGYHWWYGDDVFERNVRNAGYRVCRVVGVPCEHESDSEANDWARRPDLKALAEQDRVRWETQVG